MVPSTNDHIDIYKETTVELFDQHLRAYKSVIYESWKRDNSGIGTNGSCMIASRSQWNW